MKALFKLGILLAAVISLVSCEKASDGELLFSPKSMSFERDGGEMHLLAGYLTEEKNAQTLSFSDIWIDRNSGTRYFNETDNGTVLREVVNDWITVKVVEPHSAYLVITKPNDTGRSRSCKLSFKIGEEYSSYTVRQAK